MALTEVNSLGIKDLEVKTGDIAADAITGAKIADDQIDSEHYVDGSVDHAHLAGDCVDGDNLADNACDSEHYTDASIDHAHLADDCVDGDNIADNSVGLAHIAGGTDGQIITYDASGDPVAVGPGTDGQVLTSTGAGSPPAFEDVAAGSTPAFNATQGSMSIVDATWTKVTFDTEEYDSGSVWSAVDHRFTPGVVGTYLFGWDGTIGTGNANLEMQTKLYKNGAALASSKTHGKGVVGNHPEYPMSGSYVEESDADDYFELYAWHNSGSGWTRYYGDVSFWGIKIA